MVKEFFLQGFIHANDTETSLLFVHILITVMMGNSHSEPLNSNRCYDQGNMQA